MSCAARVPSRGRIAVVAAIALLGAGCTSDDGVSTSMSVGVGVGYGSYYGPGWYGGYYEPYPPVVVVPPDERPERPDRPTTLPAESAGGPKLAPDRPQSANRSVSRPSPRPATRSMPRRVR